MNSKVGEHIIEFNDLIDNPENIKNNACMLTITDDADGFTFKLNVNTDDDEYGDYDFIMTILDDLVLNNNNINIRKILKRLLQDRTIKAFIKKYEVEDVLIDEDDLFLDDLLIDDDSL